MSKLPARKRIGHTRRLASRADVGTPIDRDDPVAIVTGGAQGIGKAISLRLLAEGYRVVIADHDRQACVEAEAMARVGEEILVVCVDVSDEDAVKRMVAATLAGFGRIDALVNNAGIADPHSGPVETLSLAYWSRLLQVDLTGAFLCTKHVIPALRRTHGTIVNIASTRAFQSEPNTEAYAAAKGGLVALTHALAISLGPQIRTVCVSPGWIPTGSWQKAAKRKPEKLSRRDHAQHPAGRAGKPEDIAELVTYLLSPWAGFITGQNLIVDGGMTCKMVYAD